MSKVSKKKNIKGALFTISLMMFLIGFMVGYSFTSYINVETLQDELMTIDKQIMEFTSGKFLGFFEPINEFFNNNGGLVVATP